LRDEGVGIHVLRELQKRDLPPGTALIEAGTAVDTLWDELVSARRLIVVDAVEGGGPPGSVYRFHYEACPEPAGVGLSGHEVGFRDKLAALGLIGCQLPEVVVVGIEPARIEPGMDLSTQLQERLPAVVEFVLGEVGSPLAETAAVSAKDVHNRQGERYREGQR